HASNELVSLLTLEFKEPGGGGNIRSSVCYIVLFYFLYFSISRHLSGEFGGCSILLII
ncbi:hypothetical protein L9F63_015536, partial [Diploptera punctata]